MRKEMKRLILISVIGTCALSGAIAQPEAIKPINQEAIHVANVGKYKGAFREVKLINEVIGFKIDLFLNKNESHLEVGEKSEGKQDFSTIKGGYKRINWVHFVVSNLKTNQTVASGEVELDWITKDKAEVLREIMNRLKEKGITATVKEEPKDVLVITVKNAEVKSKNTTKP